MEIKKILLKIAAGMVLVLALAACSDDTAKYAGFAQCLTDKGVKMYGSFRCSHCAAQKKMFGSSFEKVTYVECDPLSRVANLTECKAQNIESYPTWIFGDGSRAVGEQTFEELAEKSSCQLPNLDGASDAGTTSTETPSTTTAEDSK